MREGGGNIRQTRENQVNPTTYSNGNYPLTHLSAAELQDMAQRQQQQIEAQQHILVAKEQRLKYLRQQEFKQRQMASEYERLRRLREKVEAQELKLRKLRAMRGQQQQLNPTQHNVNVLADLESIRSLFNEKEKELSMAVRRVDDLTKQLEEIRSGKMGGATNGYPPQLFELEHLRRELSYRQKLNEQQQAMIAQQRGQLQMGQDEMGKIDNRIRELQDRLSRKRRMNQQMASQISAATNAKQAQLRAIQQGMHNKNKNKPVSTVEPFQRSLDHGSSNDNEDPKYQTLPFGTKFNKIEQVKENNNGTHFQDDNRNNQPYEASKPVSSVAPVPSDKPKRPDSLFEAKPKPALPPKPANGSSSQMPPPYVPAPEPKKKPNSDIESDSDGDRLHGQDLDASITISRHPPSYPSGSNLSVSGSQHPVVSGLSVSGSQHPAEEGTSVDDETTDSEQPRSNLNNNVHVSRRIEMPPAFLFPEDEAPPKDLIGGGARDMPDNAQMYPMMNQIYKEFDHLSMEEKHQLFAKMEEEEEYANQPIPIFESSPVEPKPKGIVRTTNLKGQTGSESHSKHVCFDPLALLLDASLEGELDLVRQTAALVTDPSAANDEGITALHNAICAGHLDIVRFLVDFGCDVNAQDSDGWTPLHCAASCNNLAMVRFLVERGACVFATTFSDQETAAEKCEEDEEGFAGCSEYLFHIQEKMGIMNDGKVYAVYDYDKENDDELVLKNGDALVVVRKGDEVEKDWWFVKRRGKEGEGYVARNYLGLYPRVNRRKPEDNSAMSESSDGSSNEEVEEKEAKKMHGSHSD